MKKMHGAAKVELMTSIKMKRSSCHDINVHEEPKVKQSKTHAGNEQAERERYIAYSLY